MQVTPKGFLDLIVGPVPVDKVVQNGQRTGANWLGRGGPSLADCLSRHSPLHFRW